MSKTLYLLLTHYGDYDRDYERLFSDNRGAACRSRHRLPWVAEAGFAGWEERLLNKLKAANKGQRPISRHGAGRYAEKARRHASGRAVAGMWLIVQDLLALLRADERFSRLGRCGCARGVAGA